MQNQSIRNFSSTVLANYLKILNFIVATLIIYTILVNAWIGDDAQITFRQVWNFISGDGLTFNFAERVQAFTHPLWLLVLSLFSFFTKELFLTTISISIIFAFLGVLLLMKIEFDQKDESRTIISPVIFLIFSWSFCDYTTSGLENPLSFFLTGLLIYYLSQNTWRQKLQQIFVILSLLVLNRIDYLILFLPLTLYLFWNCKSTKRLLINIWPGTFLMLAWFVFATVYFGFPLPNTFFAKLNTGYPIDEILLRGWHYFLSMGDDLASVFIITLALILTLITRNILLISLTIGQFLYCLYILRLGGDFMLGRYFSLIVFISIGQIIISLIIIKNFTLITKNILVFSSFLILLFIGVFERYPFRSPIETDSRRELVRTHKFDSQIVDERSYYRPLYGLFSIERDSWPQINNQEKRQPTHYRTTCRLLGGSAIIEPNIYIIDVCGLSDPFISRLPAIQVDSWKIGQHIRKVPKNYGDFKIGKVDTLVDPVLTRLAQDMRIVTTGSILSAERLKAIWRVNSGHYSNLDLSKYVNPSIYIPLSSSTKIVHLDDWDLVIENENLPEINESTPFKYFISNIKFQSNKPRISDKIEIIVNCEFSYSFYVNGKFITLIEKIAREDKNCSQYENRVISLNRWIEVDSIELRTIDANYASDASMNAIYGLKVNEAKEITPWVMQTGNFENHRYSGLDQINKDNASQLQVVWTFSTGNLFSNQGAPLVIDDIMYVHTPFPNIVYALDLSLDGRILWKYKPNQKLSKLCCGKANRGLSFGDGKILLHQNDNTLVALDALTGERIWSSVTNPASNIGGSNTAATLVAKDKVIVGVGGGEFGVWGHISAFNLHTGKLEWRGYSTGPDEDMLIDPNFTTVLGKPIKKNSGINSWQGEQWRIGGGGTWGWFSYDTEENLLYYGTGNPAPWNPIQRPGDNKWTNSIFARNLDTGVVKWVYQLTPHDQWDFDGVNELILTERKINGVDRKLLVHFDRNGFVYTLDRVTGKLISAKKYEPSVNWATKIELEENSVDYGRPILDPRFSPEQNGENVIMENLCPSQLGAKNQQPASYSPDLELFFVPTIHTCMDYEVFEVKYVAGQFYLGAGYVLYPVPESHGGAGNLIAWDNVKGEIVWSIPEIFPVWSGVLATAGGIVIYGTFEGYLKVANSLTGEVLYKFKTPTGINGNVMTYLYDGKQYIAVFSGIGGASTIGLSAGLTKSTEFVNKDSAYTSLDQITPGGQLTVFSLPNVQIK